MGDLEVFGPIQVLESLLDHIIMISQPKKIKYLSKFAKYLSNISEYLSVPTGRAACKNGHYCVGHKVEHCTDIF